MCIVGLKVCAQFTSELVADFHQSVALPKNLEGQLSGSYPSVAAAKRICSGDDGQMATKPDRKASDKKAADRQRPYSSKSMRRGVRPDCAALFTHS